MKLLCLRGRPPWPLNTGANIRTHELLVRVADRVDCRWIVNADKPEDAVGLPALGEWETVARQIPQGPARAWFAFRHLFSPRPYQVHLTDRASFRAAVTRCLREWRPDMIYTDTISVSATVPVEVPFVMGTHNVESDILARRAARAGIWQAPFWRWEAKRTAQFEMAAARRACRVIAVSPRDQEIFQGWTDPDKVDVVPNGVDTDRLKPDSNTLPDRDLVFVGALDWFANKEGLFWFFRDVWPLITGARPHTTATIVGRRPSAALRSFLKGLGSAVETAFDVEAVEPYYRDAKLAVIPLLTGGGTRLKMVEAFALGVPVVATNIGAEGIVAETGRDFAAADVPAELASTIVRLLDAPDERQHLATNGRQIAEAHYSWDRAADTLLKSLREAVHAD